MGVGCRTQGLSAEELLDFKLFDGEGAFVCDLGDCPALQR